MAATFKKEDWAKDEVMGKLWSIIRANHKVADHDKKTLRKKRNVKDLCVRSEYFVFMGNNLYISYQTSAWLKTKVEIAVRIDTVTVYDNFMEYETARNRGLHSGKPADIPNIN